jgi:hypothetical protein
MVLGGQFIALRNSWAIVSLDVWRVSRTTFFNAGRSLSSLNVAYHRLGQLEKGFIVPERFLTDVATNNQSTFLLVLLSNEQHSFLPPFIPVIVVVVTSRLQFATTEGCWDSVDQIVYIVCVVNTRNKYQVLGGKH